MFECDSGKHGCIAGTVPNRFATDENECNLRLRKKIDSSCPKTATTGVAREGNACLFALNTSLSVGQPPDARNATLAGGYDGKAPVDAKRAAGITN
jgi:hypothetical protein